jgi:Tfp pilus assembly protein PilF
MSLLLDALKRAEQEKQARETPRDTPPGRPAPRGGLELAPIAQNDAGHAGAARAGSGAASASPSAAAAAAIAPKPQPASKRRAAIWIAAGLVVVAIASAGGYIWYALDGLAPKAPARIAAPRPIPPAAPEVAAASALPAATPVTNPLPGLRPTAPATLQPSAPPARAVAAVAHAQPESNPPLLQPVTTQRPRVAPEVALAYEALRGGDLPAARRSYSSALVLESNNLDALVGLATVEARSGERVAAASLYRRALEIDPRNGTALAGLAALAEAAPADAVESQLLRDVTQNPSSAALRFALGNLYASQIRWSQAQAAYFEAHRLAPADADVSHNLAVSLDRLGQAPLAETYYRKALEAARSHAAQFDPAAVERRLAEISAAR